MKVLICGADGFIGTALANGLAAAGWQVVRGVRRPQRADDVPIDYRHDVHAERWHGRLAGIDAVVNAVGIFREVQADDFDTIHVRAPRALFTACAAAGVGRVVQISALGCAVPPPYLRSKHAADAALHELLPGRGVVIRPGLVFGEGGRSTALFLALASLPLQIWPRTAGSVQPVHLYDLVALVRRLLQAPAPHAAPVTCVALPGPRPMPFAAWLASCRQGLGLPAAVGVGVPALPMAVAARLAGVWRGSLLTPHSWAMLRQGNVGDAEPAEALLGRRLRDPADFIAPARREAVRLQALAAWRRPLLLGVLAAIWWITAILSAGGYPLADSLALLAPFGLQGKWAWLALGGATVLDALMGWLTVCRPGRRLWWAQLALIAGYSALIAWRLPLWWLHPFGPVLKNLAIVTLLLLLLAEETKP